MCRRVNVEMCKYADVQMFKYAGNRRRGKSPPVNLKLTCIEI